MSIKKLQRAHFRALLKAEAEANKALAPAMDAAIVKLTAKLAKLPGDALAADHRQAIADALAAALDTLARSAAPALAKQAAQAVALGVRQGLDEIAFQEARWGDADTAEAIKALALPAPDVTPVEGKALYNPFGPVFVELKARLMPLAAQVLEQSIASGDNLKTAAKKLTGWVKGEAWQVERIARTEIGNAMNQGHAEAIEAVADRYPAMGLMQQWSSFFDSATSAICRLLHGQVRAPGQPFTAMGRSILRPPALPNCLPGDTLVTATGVSAGFKRWYDGDLIVIRTAGGKELSCTPNHPILTPGGWVPAGVLNVGGHVISSGGSEWVSALGDLNSKDVPPSIEEVTDALGRSDSRPPIAMPVRPEDFHGDGEGSDVAVVWANGLLRDAFNATSLERSQQLPFNGGGVENHLLPGLGASQLDIHGVLHAPTGMLGRLGKLLAAFRVSRSHPQIHRIASSSNLNTGTLKRLRDGLARMSNLGRKRLDGLSGEVVGGEGINVKVDARLGGLAGEAEGMSLLPAAHRFPSLLEDISGGELGDTELAAKLSRGEAGPVFEDQIVYLGRRYFSGHVFNLSTETGHYVANGIITHNCRSRLAAWAAHWTDAIQPRTQAQTDADEAAWLAERQAEREARRASRRGKKGLPLEHSFASFYSPGSACCSGHH